MLDLKINILIVDDFQTMRKIIRNALSEIGFSNIFQADNGLTALEVLKNEKITLIISDWNMPEMSGIEFLKAVRTSEEWKDMHFIMVTAEEQKENVIEALKNKVSNYIVKPFTPATLAEKINQVFGEKPVQK